MDNLGAAALHDETNMAPSAPSAYGVDQPLPVIKLYRRRWVMLSIFSLISMMNEVIWIGLGSVASVVQAYYQVSFTAGKN